MALLARLIFVVLILASENAHAFTKVKMNRNHFFQLRDINETNLLDSAPELATLASFETVGQNEAAANRLPRVNVKKRQLEQLRFASFHHLRPESVDVQQGPFQDTVKVFPAMRADSVKAHIVTKQINLHTPTIRVLFHSISTSDSSPDLCITLNASLSLQSNSKQVATLSQHCILHGRSTAAICEILVPGQWWKKIASAEGKSAKQKKTMSLAHIFFSSKEGSDCSGASYEENMSELEETVSLLPSPEDSTETTHTNQLLHISVLPKNIVPGSKIYIPISLNASHWNLIRKNGLTGFKIRCRLPPGMKLLSIDQVKPSSQWRVNTFINKRHSLGEMIVLPAQALQTEESSERIDDFFHCLLSVDENILDLKSSGAITWHISYIKSSSPPLVDENLTLVDEGHKIVTKVQLQKDAVQVVLPLLQHSELLNLAALNGQLQSEPLKVFIVSTAGKLADVTLQSSCKSMDNSVIKVSPSCNSIFVDGSENRGALNAEIKVNFGTSEGSVQVVVWTPKFPLDVVIEDKKLSQIRGWKTCGRGLAAANKKQKKFAKGKKAFRSLYQRSKVRVFTHFIAENPESGRQSFFPSRFSQVEVTELVKGNLNALDGQLLKVHGDMVEGKSPGKTEVQVISPLTGEVLGSGSLQVSSDEELVTRMEAQVVSDVEVSVESRPMNGKAILHLVETNVIKELSSKYEEGFIDITLRFSDDSKLSLFDLSPELYSIGLKSLKPDSIAAVYPEDSNYPHIVALTNSSGPNIRLDLRTSPSCGPLQMIASTMMEVDIKIPSKDSTLSGFDRSTTVPAGVLSEIPLKDQQEPGSNEAWAIRSSQPKRRPSEMIHFNSMESLMSLETVAYAMLALFGAAVSMILAACYVPRLRYKDVSLPWKKKEMLSSSANEWVWLGSMKRGEFDHHRVVPAPQQPPEAPLWSTSSKGTARTTTRATTTATTTPGDVSTAYGLESTNERHHHGSQITPEPQKSNQNAAFGTYSIESRNSFAQRMMDLEAEQRPRSPSTPDSDISSNFAHLQSSSQEQYCNATTPVLREPLRQSPASALPPMSEMSDNDPIDYNCNSVKNDYLLLHDSFQTNPDIRRSTPPRKGALRLFDNPFDSNDEECSPIPPESLSPNHIFEAPGSSSGGTIARLANDPVGNAAAPDNSAYELDYEKLMMFFEALKESSA